jgi:hypothetical protein
LSSFKTNFFICVGGTILSFALLFAGVWIAAQMITRTHYFGTNNKDQLISFFLIQSFILLPAVGVVVGVFLGYSLQKGAWWLVGISLLPLLIYDLGKGEWSGGEIVLNVIYLVLGFISAFAISQLRKSVFNRKTHV